MGLLKGQVTGGDSTLLELGTVVFGDINSSPVDVYTQISLLTNDLPENTYVTELFIDITTPFVSATGGLFLIPSYQLPPDGASLYGFIDLKPFTPQIYAINQRDASLILAPNNQLKGIVQTLNAIFYFDFGGSMNPQDFTAGEVTFYAEYKSFPV